MMYLVAPASFSATNIDDALAGSDDPLACFVMCTSNIDGAVMWAKTQAKERGCQMRIYKLVESQVYLP
jgi:hypothetical protein